MPTKPTDQQTEQKLQTAFFNALSPVVKGLKPEHIKVKDIEFTPDDYSIRSMQEVRMKGFEASDNKRVNIDFVKGFKLQFESAKMLKMIIDYQTGVWTTFNDSRIDLLCGGEELLDRLDVDAFNKDIKQYMPEHEVN